MGELVIGFVCAAMTGIAVYLCTYALVNGSWEDDCMKIGAHVSVSSRGGVYECKKRDAK